MTYVTHRFFQQRTTTPHTGVRGILVAIAASAVLVGGCSKNDEAKEAVNQAELEFRKVSVGDSTLSESVTDTAYRTAGDATSEFAGNGALYGEAAAVSVALSELGLASLASAEASETETAAIHQSRIIRAHLSEWIAMNAVAKASTNFDITDEKEQLKGLIKLRTADAKDFSELFETLNTEIQNLQTQIQSLDTKSVAERNESARFELQMTSVSATQAAKLAERVREHSLRADGYELESVRIQGAVGQLLPGAHEIELQVKKAMDQISLLNLSIEELDQRVRDSKTDSAQARANAEVAQSKLTELVHSLEGFRQDTSIPANEKAISLIRKSLSSSRDATKTAKASGAIAKASANEALARAYSRQSRGEAEMVSLYQSILSAGIPGGWQSKLDSHTTTRDELIESSKQAFQSAASALRSARARGDTGESMEAAAVRLDRLGGVEPEPEYNEEYESDEADYEEPVDDESEYEDDANNVEG